MYGKYVIGIDYDTALIRLMAYLPGQTLPWHHDNLGNWCRNNKHLNPMLTHKCVILALLKDTW